jgi:hypothetical protein
MVYFLAVAPPLRFASDNKDPSLIARSFSSQISIWHKERRLFDGSSLLERVFDFPHPCPIILLPSMILIGSNLSPLFGFSLA